MNIKRFYAATSREALAKARMAFGEGTLILSNRQTPDGVEVMATAEDTLQGMESGTPASPLQAAIERRPAAAKPRLGEGMSTLTHVQERQARQSQASQAQPQSVQEDVEQLSMSTLSFQDYVRERMLRRRHESALETEEALPTFAQRARQHNEAVRPDAPAGQSSGPSLNVSRHNPLRGDPIVVREPMAAAAGSMNQQHFMQELQSMKDLIEDRFNTLTWLGQTRQNPIQSSLMHKLIRAGYSPALSRALIERLPEHLSAGDAVRWLMEVLERNLRTDKAQAPIYEQGGVFALVGATGVGKTTTTAKLAALCAAEHGPSSVGLITLDTYRIGGHEQLRAYARMLGMVAHQAHDKAALQDLLGLLEGKKMVLIDTTGVAPRDPRKDEIMDVLDLPGVQQLLAVNAAAQGDALDDVMQAFKAHGSHQAVLTKVDEAVKLGPSIDTLIRHQIQLRGVTNGQRVPEDWERASAQALVSTSMRSSIKSAFDPRTLDLDFFFTPSASHAAEAAHA
jgi:flagellar biosynthesis protein FlhF